MKTTRLTHISQLQPGVWCLLQFKFDYQAAYRRVIPAGTPVLRKLIHFKCSPDRGPEACFGGSGNVWFNVEAYLRGDSVVKECLLVTP